MDAHNGSSNAHWVAHHLATASGIRTKIASNKLMDKNGIHISCSMHCSHKLYGFQGIEEVDFMQSVGNNRVGVPELCYANIYEIA
jgi:hypothetical protein